MSSLVVRDVASAAIIIIAVIKAPEGRSEAAIEARKEEETFAFGRSQNGSGFCVMKRKKEDATSEIYVLIVNHSNDLLLA